MISNEEIIEKVADAMVVFRENRQTCNAALSLAKGRMENLSKEVLEKDKRIAELEAQVEELENCREDDVTDDGWVACSERLPAIGKTVMLQMADPLLWPKVGYLSGDGKSWAACMSPKNGCARMRDGDVVAWRELPKRYEPPVVEEEERKLKPGDYVICQATRLEEESFRGVFIGEDYHSWWIINSDCCWPICLSKEYYVLIKTGKHVDIFEEDLSE